MDNRKFNLVSAILRGVWAVDPLYALQHLSWAEKIINLEQKSFFDDDIDDAAEARIATFYVMDGGVWRPKNDKDSASMTGIETLSIEGPMLKNGGWCSYGTRDYVEALQAAYQNKSVSATVIRWDTPGGQVDGTPSLHDAVRNPAKPTVSLVDDGMCCSAGVWGSIGSDAILASQLTDIIGSVGVYTTLRDAREMYKKYGVTVSEVYSTRSTEKNIEYRRALEGDLAPLRKSLDKTADIFIAAVSAARGKKLKSDEWNTGAAFTAQEAKTIGLIDDMGTFQDALSLAADMAKTRTKTSFSNPNNKNQKSDMSLLKNARNFISGKAGASGESGDEGERRDAAMETLANIAEERQTRIAELEGQLNTANSERQTAVGSLATANARITELEGQVSALTIERDGLQTKVKALGGQPGAEPTKEASEKKIEGDDKKTFAEKNAGNSMNKAAAALGL